MYRIRRGKDFKVIWSFFDCDGKPYLLEREFLRMYAVNSFCTFEVTDFTVDGNTVIWLFRGKDQKNLGDYTLELVKNNGEDGMIPIETVDAFTLVQYTRDEARCDCGNIKVEDVTINSSLDIDTIASLSIDTALSATSNNAIANFVVTRELNKKQDTIADLETIRSGAAKGATAVQNVVSSNSNYAGVTREGYEWIIMPKTKKVSEAGDPVDHLSGIADAYDVKQELAKKVDKVSGKQLSAEDFTTALKQKLQSLNNYDDSALTSAINSLQNQINTLVSGNASSAIDTFNEIIAFLNGVKDTQDLAGIIASIEQQIASVNNSLSAELAKKPNKTELATINGQSLTNGGNIVIEGKNYDAELAARNVGAVDVEGDPEAPDAPSGGAYDDTEIRAELAELSAEIDQYTPLQLALKDKSYSYVFKGNENSIATLRNPITLSKNGDSFEIEVDTEAKAALGAYPLSYCSPSGYAIGIAMDYISIRDIQGNWLLRTNIVPSSSQHLVKIQYADDKIYVYIDEVLKETINSQSDIRIESFGDGGRGSYGYWKGTILSMKVNGEQYELYKNAILGDVEIVDSETNSFLTEKEKEALESVAVLEPLAEKIAKWSYNYKFEGNSDSIATLNQPIILSKDGDSLEVEVFTEMKGANNSYTFAAKSTSPFIAMGIAADYVALRDVNNKWLYLNNTALSNTQKVKIEYIGGKVLLYINDVLKSTTDTQSDIRIDSFGDGSHGTYGYWKGTILSIKVNGEQYDLQENALLTNVVKSDSPSNSLLTDAEKKTLDSFQPTMLVRKTSETLQVGLNIPSSPYYVVYNIVHRYVAYAEGACPSFLDNWGLKKPFVGKVANGMFVQVDRIFSDGEAEIAVGVTNPNLPQTGYIVGGAAHGFDNIINTDGNRGFLLLVDSKKIDEDSELEMRPCQEVTLLQHSELCQAYTNSNPWANATKLWTLTPTSAKLKCSISILRDIKIYNGYMGMFCVERHFNGDASAPYMTSKIIKNNHPFKVFVCEDGWNDSDLQNADSECTEVTLYGDTDYGYAVRVLQSSKTKGHGMFVHYNSPSNTYNKVYPQVAANYDAKVGDVIHNEVEFVIRKSSDFFVA